MLSNYKRARLICYKTAIANGANKTTASYFIDSVVDSWSASFIASATDEEMKVAATNYIMDLVFHSS